MLDPLAKVHPVGRTKRLGDRRIGVLGEEHVSAEVAADGDAVEVERLQVRELTAR